MKKKLFIISNESISHNEKFHCDNIDLKSTPEGLNKKFDVNLLGRKSKKSRVHEIKIKKIKIFSRKERIYYLYPLAYTGLYFYLFYHLVDFVYEFVVFQRTYS